MFIDINKKENKKENKNKNKNENEKKAISKRHLTEY